MIKEVEIKVQPSKILDTDYLENLITIKSQVNPSRITSIHRVKQSIDARGSKPIYVLRYEVYIDEVYTAPPTIKSTYKNVQTAPSVIIVGAGPAGYFAALSCLEHGYKPIVLERGKDVRLRRRDLKAIQQESLVNPDSNYCFGEGGAGTYSDGKLYTRSHKRGSIEKSLRILVEHGADPNILIDAHPHIGSNKLPNIISSIRATIEAFGGKVYFDHKVTDILIEKGRAKGVYVGDLFFQSENIVLATGHSARDIYTLLYNNNISIEAKPFALGLRIEHLQSFIDEVQYGQTIREENLPASSYSVVTQVDDVGVFSFCMCPGGLIVPAATAPGEIVVNGMSLSRRDSLYANSGFVTSISVEELEAHGYVGPFAALEFQSAVEKKLFDAGNGSQKAPAQRLKDFVDGKISPTLNPTSYIPGLWSAPLHDLLPINVYKRLRLGILQINKKMKGFMTNDANIIGVESRTSAPIKIPRDQNTNMHPNVKGLYPCGEGAGYAGGILSAAMDGQKVISSIAINNKPN